MVLAYLLSYPYLYGSCGCEYCSILHIFPACSLLFRTEPEITKDNSAKNKYSPRCEENGNRVVKQSKRR